MAMSAGGGTGLKSEINITPLVDVVLVLLIIFMVATPIMQMGLDVDVPPKVEVTQPNNDQEQKQIVLTVKADGIYLNTTRMADVKALHDAIAAQMLSRPPADRVVFVNADDTIPFERAVVAMDAAHEAGAAKVGFLTDAPKE